MQVLQLVVGFSLLALSNGCRCVMLLGFLLALYVQCHLALRSIPSFAAGVFVLSLVLNRSSMFARRCYMSFLSGTSLHHADGESSGARESLKVIEIGTR